MFAQLRDWNFFISHRIVWWLWARRKKCYRKATICGSTDIGRGLTFKWNKAAPQFLKNVINHSPCCEAKWIGAIDESLLSGREKSDSINLPGRFSTVFQALVNQLRRGILLDAGRQKISCQTSINDKVNLDSEQSSVAAFNSLTFIKLSLSLTKTKHSKKPRRKIMDVKKANKTQFKFSINYVFVANSSSNKRN